MNQTFNIKRFCRYTVSYLLVNKWYLLIMVALFMVPAALLSVLSPKRPDEVHFLLIIGVIAMAMRSNVPGSPMRHLVAESSITEKFIAEALIKIVFVLIPFAVHAAMLPSVSVQTVFADGFDADSFIIIWLIMWLATAIRTPQYGSINTVSARNKMRNLFDILYFVSFILLEIVRYTRFVIKPPYPFWLRFLLLFVGMALAELSYYLFYKRYLNYYAD